MYKIVTALCLAMTLTTSALADVSVFACEPEWQSLAETLGGNRVTVYSATTAQQDPHRIEARPSLIAKLRRADLLICSGADLEAGWLPVLLQQAANKKVLPGQPGYFEAATYVELLDRPTQVDRSMGDVHAAGNPHLHLDPRRIALIAKALSDKLAAIDPDNKITYQQRHHDFHQRWQQAMQDWQTLALPLKGQRVVVYHSNWTYLFDWLGIHHAGTLEPKPGLPTTAGHLAELKQQLQYQPAKMILHTAYQNPRAAQRLSELTGIPVVELPYTVGGSPNTPDLFRLFDVTIARLLKVMP